MTTEVKKYFTDKATLNARERKSWFLDQFADIPAAVTSLRADDVNAAWLSAFNKDKNPRDALARLQKRISRMGTIRKAVLEQYIQGGEFMLDGIDFYRYSMVKNEFVADVVPDKWDGE